MKTHIALIVTCILLFYLNLTPFVGIYRSYFYVFISSGLSFYTNTDFLTKDFLTTINQAYDYKLENNNLKTTIDENNKTIVDLKLKLGEKDFINDQKNYSTGQAFIFANLTGVTDIGGDQLFTIDKGIINGISEKNTVVYKQYLVGNIFTANNRYSVVKTIESANIQIPAEVVGTDVVGIYSCVNYSCYFEKVLTSSNLNKGDFVITSGVSGDYKKGYIIGLVDKVESIPEEPFKKATVSKLINLSLITKMAVITDEE